MKKLTPEQAIESAAKKKAYHKEYNQKYYKANREKILEQVKEYSSTRKEERKIYDKDYHIKNAEKDKEYRKKNKEHINKLHREYRTKRINKDPLFKLTHNIRNAIAASFKRIGSTKPAKTEIILGCSFMEFKVHIENQFKDWMNWDNKGSFNGSAPTDYNQCWDIDHIIPLATATTEEELIKLNHYTNLQPLCSYINRYIKSDNLIY